MQLAREYGISDSTVSDILKKFKHWLSIDTTLPSASNFRKKISNYSQIEEAVSIWVDQQISRNLILNGPIIREKAKDRKSTRLNSSHVEISYAVFCLKKKKYTKKHSSYT